MKLLKIAVENQRWDLVAHTIVFASARALNSGGKADASKAKQKGKQRRGQQKRR